MQRAGLDTVVAVAEVANAGNNVLLVVQALVDHARDDLHGRVLLLKDLDALRAGEDIEEEDSFRLDAPLGQDVDGHGS